MPCATRSPNGLSAAQAASPCWGCQSPVSDENETRSVSVMVLPREPNAWPSRSSSNVAESVAPARSSAGANRRPLDSPVMCVISPPRS